MEFGITIPMQRHVGLPRPPYGEVDDLLFCWEAHRIALGGCDMLLLANASNRFAAFACMQPGEWRDWERSAVSALRASLAACGFAEGSIDAYLFFGGIPVVTRTHGRRPVAFMNVLVDKLLPLALPLPSDEGEKSSSSFLRIHFLLIIRSDITNIFCCFFFFHRKIPESSRISTRSTIRFP